MRPVSPFGDTGRIAWRMGRGLEGAGYGRAELGEVIDA